MSVTGRIASSLVGIHIFWFYFLVTGSLIRTKALAHCQGPNGDAPAQGSMTELVISTATGMALTGFVLLALGFLGFLTPVGLGIWLFLELLLFRLIRQENVLTLSFWLVRFRMFRSAWDLPAAIIYAVFLLISIPAILPPTLWDSISYHLAYAIDWTNAGRIYVDEFLRFPYYTNNFQLLYSLMYTLNVGRLCHFITWLCGLLSGLGVYSLLSANSIRSLNRWSRFQSTLANVLLPLTIALSPVFLRYIDVAYVDVPIGLFVLVPIICTCSMIRNSTSDYRGELVLTSAFCVGMKITQFLCLPLFILSLLLASHRQQRRTRFLPLCALLLLLSAPWYARNLIRTGDPITPALNLAVRGADPIFTKADYDAIRSDIKPLPDMFSILSLPIDLFANTASNFREYGTNLSVTLLYLPLLTIILIPLKRFRERVGIVFTYLNVVLIYLLVLWAITSTLGRYFLFLFPVYVSYLGLSVKLVQNRILEMAPTKTWPKVGMEMLLTFLILLMPFPTPGAKTFYEEKWQDDYIDLSQRLENRDSFFKRHLVGYVSSQAIINKMYSNQLGNKRVLVVGFENLSFYFRKRNIVSLGDWFGPGRYADLVDSVNNKTVGSYLTKFDVGAILINVSKKPMTEPQYQDFIRQLEENHFVLQSKTEPRTIAYIKAY